MLVTGDMGYVTQDIPYIYRYIYIYIYIYIFFLALLYAHNKRFSVFRLRDLKSSLLMIQDPPKEYFI